MVRGQLSHKFFLLWLNVGVLLLASVKEFIFYFFPPQGFTYLGIGDYSPIDFPVYYSYIKQVQDGAWLVRDLFTTEGPQTGMFHVLWLVLGLMARVFHLTPWWAFHAGRILLIPFLIWSIWFLVKTFVAPTAWKFTMVLVMLGGGTGALIQQVVRGTDYRFMGFDVWVPEAFPFSALLQSPHFILSMALFCLVIALWYRGTVGSGRGAWLNTVGSGLLATVLFSIHPFQMVPVTAVLLAHTVVCGGWDFKRYKIVLARLVVWGLLAAPGAVYQIWLQWGDPILQLRSAQSVTVTPSLWAVVLCFLGLWVVFPSGLKSIWSKQKFAAIFLLVWAGVQTLSLFAPIQFNRRFILGLPLVFFLVGAPVVLDWIQSRLKIFLNQNSWRATWSLVATVVAVILVFGFSSFQAMLNQLSASQTYSYLPNETMAAYAWIEQNTPPQAVVLASGWYGTVLPGVTGRTTYVGHWHETLDWQRKLDQTQAVLNAQSADQLQRALSPMLIDFILTTPDQPLPPSANLRPVFEQNGWNIFQVL